MAVKFIHCADIHLDRPFSGLGFIDEVVQQKVLEGNKKAFENIINLAIKEKVDFLLISGDLFDSKNVSLESQILCQRYFKLLEGENIKVYIARGNHDPQGTNLRISLPENVHFFSADKVETIFFQKDGETVFIHGISFPKEKVEENLALKFPFAKEGINIGVLHCEVGTGEGYSPCNLGDLKEKNYHYFALGHIHKGEILSEEPYIVYSGTHQGKNIKETGEKGCFLVSIEKGQVQIEFYKTGIIQWFCEEIEGSNLKNIDDLKDILEQKIQGIMENIRDQGAIIRFILKGNSQLANISNEDLQDLVLSFNGEFPYNFPFIWVESIENNLKGEIDLEKLKEGDFFLATLLGIFEEIKTSPSLQEKLFSDIDVLSKIDVRKIVGEIDKVEILEKAENYLIQSLAGGLDDVD
ncbi:DNA repair exonuclease SbcCD nuclease subunit [Anaerobranca californiensis DSM 14826]|jgi:DNA repair exonuclease SbcCD nuclease subunit|uniref:DNA repair exonuclease SbcCD nuclease subunit n=1 Tax=Anaerobranca californiensis DSM 14826 TaxID=1120989 RepID=A0A1M6M6J4_9FIRM|nr:DNA repair exonuclease [Anaerobranca californiensis]SHJ79082.1 DNA repair exonuclease SbcCD nuclease subunit [Anaerobranca californiensis DSM 14826]